jgi:acetyl/propionyl-CoA carboxylase alpha subunit
VHEDEHDSLPLSAMPPVQRPIKRLLVANRGEIATRILQSCRELPAPPIIFAIYTDNDNTHVSLGRPNHAIRLPSPSSYLDITYLIKLVKDNHIDAVHPGYGFLSESAEFSKRTWEEAQAVVVGPGWEVLEQTGNKLKAKALATSCDVPVLKAMKEPTDNAESIRSFARTVGYPIMIKAVDGGGGRGIRLVESEDALQNAVDRCVGESPSRTVFAEMAAVKGFRHVEVQIVGDGRGGIKHLWERDCSIQRRFQKIVEVAPAPVPRRRVIAQAIEAAVRMARTIRYQGLGTWEFLISPKDRKFYFLEINPRLQVEHTITEGITGVDLVQLQMMIAQGENISEDLRLGEWWEANTAPNAASIQLRICAEDPGSNFALSIGKVTECQFPSGNGVRVDSHLSGGGVVGTDFDNLMAKVIVTGSTWEDAVRKAQRALEDTRVVGVKTNLNLLRAIVGDRGFHAGAADTRWLEPNLNRLISVGDHIEKKLDAASSSLPRQSSNAAQQTGLASSSVLFRKGDAWSLTLEETGKDSTTSGAAHHLKIDRILRNKFPQTLSTDILYTVPGHQPVPYKVTLASTSASADATSSTHRRGDPNNKAHIILPMSGKLMEVLVEEGDEIKENDVIAFVKQMKMELEIRSPRAGKIGWVVEVESEDGDDVAEGVLLAELVDEGQPQPRLKSKI